jgi:hypothetical protein
MDFPFSPPRTTLPLVPSGLLTTDRADQSSAHAPGSGAEAAAPSTQRRMALVAACAAVLVLGTVGCEDGAEGPGGGSFGTGTQPAGSGDASVGTTPGLVPGGPTGGTAGGSAGAGPGMGNDAGAPGATTGGAGIGSVGDGSAGLADGSAGIADGGSAVAADGGSPGKITCSAGQVPVNGQCVARKLPENLGSGWVEIEPGPPTTCVTGAPYSFYVRKGTVNKVMLFMQGGGACWDDATCLLPIYIDVPSAPGNSGILDSSNPANPFKDWYVVFAPYCSGDTFLGDATQDYGFGPLQFKGAVNMKAVRDWITTNVTAPEFFFVSGCSAGAVGVPLHGGFIARAYQDNPEVDGAMVTDSFQAIIPDGFAGIKTWNVIANIPDWLPTVKSLKEPYPGDIMRRGVKEALSLPEFARFQAANFNFAEDGVQGLFYGFMGGDGAQIGQLISEATHDLAASRPDNYRFYSAPGDTHCVFEDDGVYGITTGGVRLIDWLGNLSKNVDVKSVEP